MRAPLVTESARTHFEIDYLENEASREKNSFHVFDVFFNGESLHPISHPRRVPRVRAYKQVFLETLGRGDKRISLIANISSPPCRRRE